MKTKRCAGACKQTLPLSRFHKNRYTNSGYATSCKKCLSEYHRIRYKNLNYEAKALTKAKREERIQAIRERFKQWKLTGVFK